MCWLLIVVVFVKMSPDLMNSLKDLKLSSLLSSSHTGGQEQKLIETVNARHMLPSEMLWFTIADSIFIVFTKLAS